jgi:uncharacterized coiled-coil protein SlyX
MIEDPRLTDLELRYMRLERSMDDLSDVVVQQGKLIDRLEHEVVRLKGQLAEGSEKGHTQDERPPHY